MPSEPTQCFAQSEPMTHFGRGNRHALRLLVGLLQKYFGKLGVSCAQRLQPRDETVVAELVGSSHMRSCLQSRDEASERLLLAVPETSVSPVRQHGTAEPQHSRSLCQLQRT